MKLIEFFEFPNVNAMRAVGACLPTIVCLSLAGAAQAAAVAPSADAELRAIWRTNISSAPLPSKGCFTASYPDTVWTPVACTTAPDRRYLPAHGPSGFTVGNGNDYAVEVAGIITSAVGKFSRVRGLTQETNEGSSNQYSLQLNSQFFASPTCQGAKNPSNCLGWEQFIYAQQASGGGDVFMQYWLINYDNPCPQGWNSYSGSCYRNSSAAGTPSQALSEFHDLQLSGSAVADGTDTVKLTTSDKAYSATGEDSVEDLAGYWNGGEYNVFGDGGGSQADFNTGTRITVKIAVKDGSTNAPTCKSGGGTSGETNNLNLGKCAAASGTTPSITFKESN